MAVKQNNQYQESYIILFLFLIIIRLSRASLKLTTFYFILFYQNLGCSVTSIITSFMSYLLFIVN